MPADNTLLVLPRNPFFVHFHVGTTQEELYSSTRAARTAFLDAIRRLGKGSAPSLQQVPKVAVVSFAAPRVGDINYTKVLGHRSVMSPLSVLEPGQPGTLGNVPVAIRDWLVQVRRALEAAVWRSCLCLKVVFLGDNFRG